MPRFRHVSAACALALLGALVPAPAGGQPATPGFSLADALALARDRSPEGEALRARVDAARRAAGEAGRWPNPLVELRTENFGPGASEAGLPLDTFATVTQPIELGGKRAARRGVADGGLGAAEAEARVAQSGLALEIAAVYLDAVRQRDRRRVLAEQAGGLDELVRVVGRRVAVGSAPESDVLKLRTEAARSAAELVRTELAAARALVQLEARLDVDTTADALALPAPPAVPPADVAAAVERRPDVQNAGQAVELARRQLRLEDARAVPDVAVHTGLKRTAGFNTGVVAVTMAVPLFDRNRPARILAQGQVAAAEFERAAVVRRARGEIDATREAAARLADRARVARAELVEPARGARDAARSAFQMGALDVLRLIDAERVFADASLVALDLEIDAVAAAIEARLAAGEDPLP